MSIKTGDQVLYRRLLSNNLKQVLLGNVVAVQDSMATVQFPTIPGGVSQRKEIPVGELEAVAGGRFGPRARVQFDPLRRSIGSISS